MSAEPVLAASRRAPLPRMVLAQTGMELRLTLRNGEQLLLTAAIPTLLLVLFTGVHVSTLPGRRVDFLVPGILALAVLSTAFTGQAILTGFERRYGVLKLLGAAPLPRWALLLAKTATVLFVESLQFGLLVVVGLGLGWHPHGSPGAVVLLALLGTASFSGLGLLLAGTLRAEATLAAANLVYLLLLTLGGILFPLSEFPAGLRPVLSWLPAAALSDGFRVVLRHAQAVPAHDWLVLAGWGAGALALAALTFRWE